MLALIPDHWQSLSFWFSMHFYCQILSSEFTSYRYNLILSSDACFFYVGEGFCRINPTDSEFICAKKDLCLLWTLKIISFIPIKILLNFIFYQNLLTFRNCLAIPLILLYSHIHIYYLCPHTPIQICSPPPHIYATPICIHNHIDMLSPTRIITSKYVLDGRYTRMLHAVLNKSKKQHLTK